MRWSVVDLPRPLALSSSSRFLFALPSSYTHTSTDLHARTMPVYLPTNLPTYGDPARLTHCHTNNQPPFYHVTVHHSAPMWSFRLCRGRAAVENGDVKTATEVRDGERGRCCCEGAAGGAEGRTTKRDREDRQRERETDTQFGTSSGTYVKAPTKFRNRRRSETQAVNTI